MKLALINPPAMNGAGEVREECCWHPEDWATTPTALLQLATVARRHAEIAFLDSTVEQSGFEGVEAFIREQRPDAVVCPITWPTWPHASRTVSICNRLGVDCVVLPIPFGYAEDYVRDMDLLFAMRWEPEVVIEDWLKGVPLAELRGAVYRNEAGEVITNPEPERRFASLPATAWDLAPLRSYGRALINVERDCPYKCEFCTWATHPQQLRSVDVVLEEILALDRGGVPFATLQCAQLTTNKKWLRKLCAGLAEAKISMSWDTDIHANEVDDEVLTLMRDAGCTAVFMGLETTNNDLAASLKMGKKLAKNASAAIASARRVGIHLTVPFLFNIGETDADVEDYIRFVEETRPPAVSETILGIYKGTPLHERTRDQPMDTFRDHLVNVRTFPGLQEALKRRDRFRDALANPLRRWKAQWYLTNPHARNVLARRKLAQIKMRTRNLRMARRAMAPALKLIQLST